MLIRVECLIPSIYEMLFRRSEMIKKKKKQKSEELAAQSGAASEVVSRYGSASKEHLVAYSGVDYERGQKLVRGLKKTAASKVNKNYANQNIKQQAGFAAEDKYTARQNAEKIISGSKERYIRTDDLGCVNDPLFDHVLLDEDGVLVLGSGEQMKFVGNSPKTCLAKLASPKFQKYLDADAKITVPSDFYPGILKEAEAKIQSLQRQLDHASSSGNQDLVDKLKKDIARYKKIQSSVKDSGITNKEAIEARLHPKISTAKDIVRISHRAGMEQAKTGALVGGGISLIKNTISVIKGETEPFEAAKSITLDTGKGAIVGYATAFAGSALKAGMQNASNSTARVLSKTNAPAMIVTSTIDLGKSMMRFAKGQISGVELLEEVGEKGTGHLSGAMFAIAGQAVIPIPIVGAMVGSMVGYALSSAFYKELTSSLKDAKLARETRIRIEKECKEAIKYIRQCRQEMNRLASQYLSDYQNVFNSAFSDMDAALLSGDIDLFILGANKITKKLGGTVQYDNMNEFESFMNNDEIFLTL